MEKHCDPPCSAAPLHKGGVSQKSPLSKGGCCQAGGITSPHRRNLISNGYHLPYNPSNIENARRLRKEMTPQERKLWYRFLRTYPIRFLRQRPVDHFILDFYCAEHKLAIELDGSQHYTTEGTLKDKQRTEILSLYGIRVLRFTNKEVDEQFDTVCAKITAETKIPPA